MLEIYFAGSQCREVDELLMEKQQNRLMSQLNDRSLIRKWVAYKKENPDTKSKIFIDSGAYTASTKGVTIDLDEYIDYIDSITDYIDIVAPLDVIPTPEQTNTEQLSMDNYWYMEARMKHPEKLIPVFHQGESWKHLQDILDIGKDYIALGGLVGASRKMLMPFFQRSFKIISDHERKTGKKIRVHAFGMTSEIMLENFPFISADSTSYIMTGSRGSIFTPHGTILVSDKQDTLMKHYAQMLPEAKKVIDDWLESIGFSYHGVSTNYKHRMLVNILYLIDWYDKYEYKGTPIAPTRLF